MRKLLIMLAAMFVTVPALAATVNVSWTHPTEYTDNSALNAADIRDTRVEWGTCTSTNGFGTEEGEILVDRGATGDPLLPPPNAVTITANGFGDKCFRAYTRMKDEVGGLTSNSSAVVVKNIPSKRPRPPGFTTAGVVLVYTIRLNRDNEVRLADAVGRAPEGTACGAESLYRTARRDFHEVSAEDIRFLDRPVSGTLVASCVPAA